MQGFKFNSQLISDDVAEAERKLHDLYASIPSIEIRIGVIRISLFKQIEFFWDSCFFETREEALAVWDDVHEPFISSPAIYPTRAECSQNYQYSLAKEEGGSESVLILNRVYIGF